MIGDLLRGFEGDILRELAIPSNFAAGTLWQLATKSPRGGSLKNYAQERIFGDPSNGRPETQPTQERTLWQAIRLHRGHPIRTILRQGHLEERLALYAMGAARHSLSAAVRFYNSTCYCLWAGIRRKQGMAENS
jgi:hypothetical protein